MLSNADPLLSGEMILFYSMKSDKKTFVAPAIVFTPLKPVTSAHGSSGGHPTTLQPLLHTWTRPVVLLSPATPWAAQPPIPSASEISSMQNNCQKAKVMDMASTDSMQVGDGSNVRWVPRIDMLFDSENDAYEFYNAYAENVGFIVRRSTLWTSKNIITRRTFVCSREGFREKKKGAKEAKCPRPETRIGCPACMTIRLTPSGKYRVTEFAPNHNHQIATVSTIHTLRAKKLRRKARVARADLTDDTVTTPEFETEDDAYEFYNMYAGRLGFSVRRASVTVNAENAITRRMFVCSREGFREQKKGAKRVKKPRPEFRTGCPACMVIRITPSGKYQVTEFVTYHNHQLEASLSTENLISQTADNGLDRAAEMADESAENADNKQVQSRQHCTLLSADKKNHLQTKRIKAIQVGDAGATLEYLQKMQEDNPSFYYAIKVDKDDDLSNFFWADAKSMMDFCYFGDVVFFDTTYKILGYGRPFVLFTGVNHHHQTIIFGAALLYDENTDSVKWLFESFKAAMSGKQPKTILTERSAVISEAIAAVWPGTIHRFCIWHIYQNAVMQLSQAFHGSKTFGYDFSRCLFDFEDEEDFLREWEAMCRKYELKENEWLGQLFEEREKWSLVYGREAFYADMKSAQQKESIGTELKKYLTAETDLLSFFENYEKILSEKRSAELQADFSASLNTKKSPSMRMLKQAANAYTPAAYRMFEREFESYMDCMLYSLGEVGTISQYNVIVDEKPKEHLVKFDSVDGSATCSCKKFEFLGIQCCHVLKVLDTRNIKEIPSQYILKRWRKDAKNSELSQNLALSFGDPQSSVTNRCNILCRIFGLAAAHAAKSLDSYAFLEGQAELLNNQIEQFLQTRSVETTSVISAPSDRLQNPVESGVPESLQYDKTNQAIFVDSTSHGFLGSRQSHPTMCWGQFSSGPPEL
ncbi:protein FAR1-RELATED SEQUENCE 5-like isoform X1 [Zingiber officinale]|uniref:protein FAR1-RELATED SEQUENCE 5-like isoform X1 n=2 Tax=Zingiber officinale TaxID=94328 RepID=UPI001C4ABC52|nr:protein FAR1-RELATED SEQUENCE 5-like isoform X1 [Zingiber officinale]